MRRGDFVLKSGRPSTWFIDSKQTICAPDVMVDVATLILERIPEDATAIGGLTMGADGATFITAGVAATRGRNLHAFSVRKEVKDHGAGGRIAGVLEPGDRVVITEDTVTRGTSLLEAAHVVRDYGAEVADAARGRGPRRHGRGDGGRRGHRLSTPSSPRTTWVSPTKRRSHFASTAMTRSRHASRGA